MAFENLLIETKGRIRYIIINRESKLNALNAATITELDGAIHAALNDSAVGGVILTGAGEKAFVAGADIAEFAGLDEAAGLAMAKRGHSVFNTIENGGKPVIAAVNGFALGGGLELAMACHIRIASENAKLGLPEVSLGLIPGYGGTKRLTRLIGKGKAMELIMTGDMITARDALQAGLVNHVVEQEEIRLKAEEILSKILSRAPLAIAAAINAINAAETEINGNEIELKNFSKLFNSSDLKEGISSFIAKKKPDFKGL
jgi:enoyl-CoA hydratase